jgi:hypothetical protein
MASEAPDRLTEEQATKLAWEGVERAGGTRQIYRHPRHPFSLQPAPVYTIDGHEVEVVHGEISSRPSSPSAATSSRFTKTTSSC